MAIFRVPARIDFDGPGAPGLNVWNVRTVGPGNEDEVQLEDAVQAITNFYTALRPLMPVGQTVTLGEGIIKDPLGDSTYGPDLSRIVTGNGQNGQAPQLLAICVSWRTSSASRSGRGRTFFGPIVLDALQGDGTIETAALNSVRGAAAALVSASTGPDGWSVGVLSTKQGLLRDITGYTVKDQLSYLSSRRD